MTNQLGLLTSDEVRAFINKNSRRYLEALEIVKGALRTFRFSQQGRNAIYTVYSRGERQRGEDELKDGWQVKEKVNKMRVEGDPRREVPPNPDFPIQDVGDIIALTAVCAFPADIDVVRDSVKNQEELLVLDEEDKEERGYRAIHFVLGLRDRNYAGIRCELQVKTILHDAWTAKTHDLTYKPRGSLPVKVVKLMESVSDVLTAMDAQSELLREEIHTRWDWERRRKEACRMALARALIARKPSDEMTSARYEAIAEDLRNNEDAYREGDISGVIDRIEEFAGTTYDASSCRLAAYLASIRATHDLDETALDYIERWLSRPLEPRAKVAALNFRGLVLFCFGRLTEAGEAAENALLATSSQENPDLVNGCKANLAYYLAESTSDVGSLRARRARALVEEVVQAAGGESKLSPPDLKDIVGYIKIGLGRSRSEIAQGLTLCDEASKEDPESPVLRAFVELHTEIAQRRLDSPELPE